MAKIEWRTAYGPKLKVDLDFTDSPSRTKQSMHDETEINNIIAKYRRTGVVEHLAKYQGDYGEFADLDYQTALNQVIAANEMFASLPADIRGRFANDPAGFIRWVNDSDNESEARELGLLEAAPLVIEPTPGPLPGNEPAPAPEPAP